MILLGLIPARTICSGKYKEINFPILSPHPPSYLFQLFGIAQGFTPEEMGLGMQKIKAEKLLKQGN